MTEDPNLDKWWHSPQMVGGMWSLITVLFTWIGWVWKQWRHDHGLLHDLKKKIDDLDNGVSLSTLRAQVKDIHEWYMENVVKRGRR